MVSFLVKALGDVDAGRNIQGDFRVVTPTVMF